MMKRLFWLLSGLFLLFGVLMVGWIQGRAAPEVDEPSLVSMAVSPVQVPRTGTATFTLVFEDPQGAANLLQYYFGFSNCTISIGEAYQSDFERNFARFFGVEAYRTYAALVASSHNGNYGCSGGQFETPYPWNGSTNQPGTATLVSKTETLSGNQLSVAFTVNFNNFPLGTYRAYYMVRDQENHWHSGLSAAWWQGMTVQVINPPTATPTPTGTLPPTATRTPTVTSTAFPTLTPTPTPIPNNPPFLANLTLSKITAFAHDTITFSADFYDAQGGNTVDRAYFGFTPCVVNPGEAYNSHFERKLSSFFGTYTLLGGMNKYVARLYPHTNCSGGMLGQNPWSSVLTNAPNTASLVSAAKTVSGNQATVAWTVNLTGFASGTYTLYTMARDIGGLWSSGSSTAAWQPVPAQQFYVAPTPDPEIDFIHLGGQNAQSVTIPEGASIRVKIQVSNLAPAGGTGQDAYFYVSFPGQTAAFLDAVSQADGTSPGLTYTELAADPTDPVVKASKALWGGGETNTLELLITPPQAGTFELLTKVVLPQGGVLYRDPLPEEAGTEPDQHGDAAFLNTLLVEPAISPLSRLNYYRSLAGVPQVTENLAWSQGCENHALYMTHNGLLTHTEDPDNAWYTPEGAAAGQASNLSGFTTPNLYEAWFTDVLMQAVFHALPMLNPILTQAGYGSNLEGELPLPAASCLDVWRGIDYGQTGTYPVFWPPQNGLTPLVAYNGGELPDPLTSCAGYTAPSGPPVFLILGNDAGSPTVNASSFTGGGQTLTHCVFTETTYTNPDPAQQTQGRSTLDFFDGVVLIPREPLQLETPYTVSLTVNGQAYTWSFQVAPGVVVLPEGEMR